MGRLVLAGGTRRCRRRIVAWQGIRCGCFAFFGGAKPTLVTTHESSRKTSPPRVMPAEIRDGRITPSEKTEHPLVLGKQSSDPRQVRGCGTGRG